MKLVKTDFRQWVEKGELNYPRTGHTTRLVNEQIWVCGGATPGDTYEQTNQAYNYTIYRTGNDFLNQFPEDYTGIGFQ